MFNRVFFSLFLFFISLSLCSPSKVEYFFSFFFLLLNIVYFMCLSILCSNFYFDKFWHFVHVLFFVAFWNRSLLKSRLFRDNTITSFMLVFFRIFMEHEKFKVEKSWHKHSENRIKEKRRKMKTTKCKVRNERITWTQLKSVLVSVYWLWKHTYKT